MFFHMSLERNMKLHPRYLGKNVSETLARQLVKEMEGTCRGKHGYLIAVTGIERVGHGEIVNGTAYVTFPVKYNCIVFRPFKREIYEALVSRVINQGFFAEAGCLSIFVSTHCMPDSFELERCGHGQPQFVDRESWDRILPEAEVRVQIVGARFDASEISCIGTIIGDYLGVIRTDNHV